MAEVRSKIVTIEGADETIKRIFQSNAVEIDGFRAGYDSLVNRGIRPSLAAHAIASPRGEFEFIKLFDFAGRDGGDIDTKFLMNLCAILRESNSALRKVLSGEKLEEQIREDGRKTIAWLDKVGIGKKTLRSDLTKFLGDNRADSEGILFAFEKNWSHRIKGGGDFIPDIEQKVVAWVNDPDIPRWTPEERIGVEKLIHSFSGIAERIINANNLTDLHGQFDQLLGLTAYLGSKRGIEISGDRLVITGAQIRLNDEPTSPLPKELKLEMDLDSLFYHLVFTLFEISGLKNLNPFSRLDREKAVESLAKVNPDKREWLEAVMSFANGFFAKYETEAVRRFALEQVEKMRTWLDETGLGGFELREAIDYYIAHYDERDLRVFLPVTRIKKTEKSDDEAINYQLCAYWVMNSGSADWTKEAAAGARAIVDSLALSLFQVIHAPNLKAQRDAGSQILAFISWLYKAKGIKTLRGQYSGVVPKEVRDFPSILPNDLAINAEVSVLSYHLAVNLFKITGLLGKNPFDPRHRQEAVELLLAQPITQGERSWLITIAKLMDGSLIQPLTDVDLLFEYATERSVKAGEEDVMSKMLANDELRAECSRPDYVAGQLQGYASTSSIKPVVSLYIGRTSPGDIEVLEDGTPQPPYWLGYIQVIIRNKAYKVDWKMGADGKLLFVAGGEEFGWDKFGANNPPVEDFFLSIEHAVLTELKKALVRQKSKQTQETRPHEKSTPTDDVEEEPKIPIITNGGTVIHITGRRERTRREILRERTDDENAEATAVLNQRVAKYGELITKIGSSRILEEAGVTSRDLEGLELYVLEDIFEAEERVGQIHVIGDTRELVQVTLENPELREKVFLCKSRAHIRRAGYKASKLREGEASVYRSQKIPTSVSEIRRKSIQKHFGIGDLNLEVRQETDLNVSLGLDIENPSIKWIVLGPAEAIHKYRTKVSPADYTIGRREDGCFFIRITDVVDLEQVAIKKDLPEGIVSADLLIGTDKDGNGVWKLSLTAKTEQLPQFYEGEYINLIEAERRYRDNLKRED